MTTNLSEESLSHLEQLMANYRSKTLELLNSRDRNLIEFYSISVTSALYEVFKKLQNLSALYEEAKAGRVPELIKEEIVNRLKSRSAIFLENLEKGEVSSFTNPPIVTPIGFENLVWKLKNKPVEP